MKIGVFDSGIGGEAIARTLQHDFPEADFVVVSDRANMPYGDKTQDEIVQLSRAAVKPLIGVCEIIVIACNTATAAALPTLRSIYPEQKFVGIEPMLKPAATLTHSGIIAVCATPATLASEHYQSLKHKYAADVTVLEPDCRKWAHMIESNQSFEQEIWSVADSACTQGADVIVLACTHYHWIKKTIDRAVAGRAIVIEPSRAISERVRQLIALR